MVSTINMLLSRVRKEDVTIITYKELCTEPVRIFEQLADFLGIQWMPEILDVGSESFFGSQIHHNIGGNPTRMSRIDSIHYYKRWPDNLSNFEKIAFIVLGGTIINWFSKLGP